MTLQRVGQLVHLGHHLEASPPHLANLGACGVACQGSDAVRPRSGVALIGRAVRSMVRGGGVVGSNRPRVVHPVDSATAGVSSPAGAVDVSSPGRLWVVRCRA